MDVNLHFPHEFDARVTTWVLRCWGKSIWFDAAMMVVAAWTPVVMMGVIVIASSGLFLCPPFQHQALRCAIAAVAAALTVRIANEPISRWAARSRPFEALGFRPLVYHESGDAFPSNHAAGALALSMSMFPVPGYNAILLALALLLCTSRLYAGLHHLTDILAGVLHGTAAAWVIAYIAHYRFGAF